MHWQRVCGWATGLIYRDSKVAIPNVTFSSTSSSTDWERETGGEGELRQQRSEREVALEDKCLGVNNWEEDRFPTAPSIILSIFFPWGATLYMFPYYGYSTVTWSKTVSVLCTKYPYSKPKWADWFFLLLFFILALKHYTPLKCQYWLWEFLNVSSIIQVYNSSCIWLLHYPLHCQANTNSITVQWTAFCMCVSQRKCCYSILLIFYHCWLICQWWQCW